MPYSEAKIIKDSLPRSHAAVFKSKCWVIVLNRLNPNFKAKIYKLLTDSLPALLRPHFLSFSISVTMFKSQWPIFFCFLCFWKITSSFLLRVFSHAVPLDTPVKSALMLLPQIIYPSPLNTYSPLSFSNNHLALFSSWWLVITT